MNKIIRLKAACVYVLLCSTSLFGQGRPYDGPVDAAGDIAFEREGFMDGNRVKLLFQNRTELSGWPRTDSSLWPNTIGGLKMNDGVGLVIGARVYLSKTDSFEVEPGVWHRTVIDNPVVLNGMAPGSVDTLYFLQSAYREEQDSAPDGFQWRFYPAPGYFNPSGINIEETPALSDDPNTWPVEGWPLQGNALGFQGEWDGRFGRGVIKADLECYFVANDAQDQEYTPTNSNAPLYYYPKKGVKIGDKRPDVTTNFGAPWGGIGIRVQQRGFQWTNPQAQDALFWEYTIANTSDYNLTEMAFGYWVDNALGGADGDDDFGAFDKLKDLAYSWDQNGIGLGGFRTGTMGFAYLESPGKPFDGRDNDDDGLRDEERENLARAKVGPISNPYLEDLGKFLQFYNLREEDLKEHWDADEDQDWNSFTDENGNGLWDEGEVIGDDVGLDGVAPGDLNYFGPDLDGTEGNGRPDYDPATNKAEPNFASTDVTESDMIGLTAFRMWSIVNPHNNDWFWNDPWMWTQIGVDSLVEFSGETGNIVQIFASGVFPLFQGRQERISMAEIHSFDPLSGLQSDAHTSPALFTLKDIAQIIFETDYRFAQPPLTPTLTATPGDGEVVLTWDNLADTKTREPFLKNINDFEGYKIYRSTDKFFTDAELITDGYGTPTLKQPIFQCDIKDGKTGFTDYGLINGVGVNLGYDTGLTHHFIDRDVQNGRTYYYALVSYDYGIPKDSLEGGAASGSNLVGISPSESKSKFTINEQENIETIPKNMAIATPRTKSAGYQDDTVFEVDDSNLLGNGRITPIVAAKNSLKEGHTYKATFESPLLGNAIANYDHGFQYYTGGIRVFDVTGGPASAGNMVFEDVTVEDEFGNFNPTNLNTVLVQDDSFGVYHVPPRDEGVITGIFDGLQLNIQMDIFLARYDSVNTGWLEGGAGKLGVIPSVEQSLDFPWDYDIVFTDDSTFYRQRLTSLTIVENHLGNRIINQTLRDQSYSFYVRNVNFKDSTTADGYEWMDIITWDTNGNGKFDALSDTLLIGPITTRSRWAGTIFAMSFSEAANADQLPKPGDVYRVTFQRPFFRTDTLTFSYSREEKIEEAQIKTDLDNVRVVPNPYIVTNTMEPSLLNPNLNQRRRLLFTNIPAECTIKIFTISGTLVDEINVVNPTDNGIVHWDMLSREGFEIAAGMYLYHIKATLNGAEKIGKFAVIK